MAVATRRAARRPYRMEQRARDAVATRERIVASGIELFMRRAYDKVRLEQVAAAARVSLPTILRHFGSKEGLLAACAKVAPDREKDVRTVTPGDIDAACRMLAARYEQTHKALRRYLTMADHSRLVADALRAATRSHLEWLEETFLPFLPHPGRSREIRLAQLFGATELYVWSCWRDQLGLSAAQAEAAMRETIEALVARWRLEKSRD